MTLADLTDAHVRALLDPDGCSVEDWEETVAAGLAFRDHGYSHPTTKALLAEAQRIADALFPDEVATLREDTTCFYLDDARVPEQHGLLRRLPGHHAIGGYEVTPAGRLVLALRERSR